MMIYIQKCPQDAGADDIGVARFSSDKFTFRNADTMPIACGVTATDDIIIRI